MTNRLAALCVVSIFAWQFFTSPAWSQAPPAVQRIYVPDNATQSWPPGDWVPIAGRELQAMLDTLAPPARPQPLRIRTALYRAELQPQTLAGDVEMALVNDATTDQAIPLSPLNLSLSEVRLDGQPADWGTSTDQNTYAIIPPGEHVLRARWSVPCTNKLLQRDCLLQFPAAELSRAELTLPQDLDIDLSGGVQRRIGEPADGLQRWQLNFGNRNEARLLIRPSPSAQPTRASIRRRSLTWLLNPDDASCSDVIEVKVHAGILDRMTFLTSPHLEFENATLSTGEPLTFTTSTQNDLQTLVVHLPLAPAGTEFIFRLRATLLNQNQKQKTWTMPECLPQGILWQNHQVTIQIMPPLEYLTASLVGYQMTSPVEALEGGQRLTLSKTAQSGQLTLQLIKPSFELAYQVHLDGLLTPSGLVYRQTFDISSLSGRLEQLIADIPENIQILNVQLVHEAFATPPGDEGFRWRISPSPQVSRFSQLRIDILKPQLASQGARIQIDAFHRFPQSPWLATSLAPVNIQPLLHLQQGRLLTQHLRLEHDPSLRLNLTAERTATAPALEPTTLPAQVTAFAPDADLRDPNALQSLLPASLRTTIDLSRSTATSWQIPESTDDWRLEISNDDPNYVIRHTATFRQPLLHHEVLLQVNSLQPDTSPLLVEIHDALAEPHFSVQTASGVSTLLAERRPASEDDISLYQLLPPATGWSSLTAPLKLQFHHLLKSQTRLPRILLPSLKVTRSSFTFHQLPVSAQLLGLQTPSAEIDSQTTTGVYTRDQPLSIQTSLGENLLPPRVRLSASLISELASSATSDSQQLIHDFTYELRGNVATPITIDLPAQFESTACEVNDISWPIDPSSRRVTLPPSAIDSNTQLITIRFRMVDHLPIGRLWSTLACPLPHFSLPMGTIAWTIRSPREELFLDPAPLTKAFPQASLRYSSALSRPQTSTSSRPALTQRTARLDRTWQPQGWLRPERTLRGYSFQIHIQAADDQSGLQADQLNVLTLPTSTVSYLSLATSILVLTLGTLLGSLRWLLTLLSLVALTLLVGEHIDPWSILFEPSLILIASVIIAWMIPHRPRSQSSRLPNPASPTRAKLSTAVLFLAISFLLMTSSKTVHAITQAQPVPPDRLSILIPFASDHTNALNIRPPLADEPIVYIERLSLADLRERAQVTQFANVILFRRAEYSVDVQSEQTLVFAQYELSLPTNSGMRDIPLPFQNVAFSGINGCFINGRPAGISSSATRPGILVTWPDANADTSSASLPEPQTPPAGSSSPERQQRQTSILEIAFFLKKAPAPGTFFPVDLPFVHQAIVRRIDGLDVRHLFEVTPPGTTPHLITESASLLASRNELHLKLSDTLPTPIPTTLTFTPETLITLQQNMADISLTHQMEASQAGICTLALTFPPSALPLDVRSLHLTDSSLQISDDRPTMLIRLQLPEPGRYSLATRFLLPLPDQMTLGDFADLIVINPLPAGDPLNINFLPGPIKLQSRFRQRLIVPDSVAALAATVDINATSPAVFPVELAFPSLATDDRTPLSIEAAPRQLTIDSFVTSLHQQPQQLQLLTTLGFSELHLPRFQLELAFPSDFDVQQIELLQVDRIQPLLFTQHQGRLFIQLTENDLRLGQLTIQAGRRFEWTDSNPSEPIKLTLPRVLTDSKQVNPSQLELTTRDGVLATITPTNALRPLHSDLDLVEQANRFEVPDNTRSLNLSFELITPPVPAPEANFDVALPIAPHSASPDTHLNAAAQSQPSLSPSDFSPPLDLTYHLTTTSAQNTLLGELTLSGEFSPGKLLRFQLPSSITSLHATMQAQPLTLTTDDEHVLTLLLPEALPAEPVIKLQWSAPSNDWTHLTLPTPIARIASAHIHTAFPFSSPQRYLVTYPPADSNRLSEGLIQLHQDTQPVDQLRSLSWLLTFFGIVLIMWLTRRAWFPFWNGLQQRGIPLIATGLLVAVTFQIWLGLGLIILGLCCWTLSFPQPTISTQQPVRTQTSSALNAP